jgi:predicted SnoaL-like aldol condensation-catalyzing enzyme
MNTRTLSFACLTLAASLPLNAQEPVVGVDDPESLFVHDDPVLHRNKQAALHIMRELLQCNQWDRAGEWLTERYIQHNPNAESGLEGVVYYFTEVLGREPTATCDELTTPIVAVMAEGDLVTVILPREYDHPANAGETYTTTWFDTWRFVDGKADEHWDPAQISTP